MYFDKSPGGDSITMRSEDASHSKGDSITMRSEDASHSKGDSITIRSEDLPLPAGQRFV
jgi:hypothetical protein